jgi:hypothetical protein
MTAEVYLERCIELTANMSASEYDRVSRALQAAATSGPREEDCESRHSWVIRCSKLALAVLRA